jgi:hypothetical protein
MKTIPLTQGQHAIVDGADYPELSQFKWYALRSRNTFYAVRNEYRNSKQHSVRMHRVLLRLEHGDKQQGDHRDGCGLNNSMANLRLATNQQNTQNKGPHRDSFSGFKGVSWHKRVKKWAVEIMVNGKHRYLRYFASATEAARAYDHAALKYFGEFAYLNFSIAKAA